MVTPGFIDGHTHMDAQVFWDATGSSSCWHGVTSAVMGNCGFTLAPVRADERALVVRNLERAEDIDPAALAAGIDWSFETFPEYLDAVDRLPKGINFAANIGHSALRTWAMGERAFEQEATDDDLALMKGQLADALRAGAIGFSTSRSEHHETSDDRPVASRLASWDEVVALVGVMGDARAPASSKGPTAACPSPDPEVRAGALDRMQALAAETPGADDLRPGGHPRAPATCSTSSTRPPPPGAGSSPRPTAGASRCCCRSRPGCPSTSSRRGATCGPAPLAEQLRDPGRPRAAPALRGRRRRRPTTARWNGVGAQARPPDFEGIRVYQHGLPPNPSVADVARQRGVHPAEAMIDLCVESGGDQLFIQPSLYPQDEAVLLRALRHPRDGHDLLGLGRPPEPDRRLLDPHPPARATGCGTARSSPWRRRSA